MAPPLGIKIMMMKRKATAKVISATVSPFRPKIIQQEPIIQQHVELVVDSPIPMTPEEIEDEPIVIKQEGITQQHDEMVVDSPDPMIQEEFVHEPKIIQQEPIITPREEKLHRRLLELEARVEGLVGTSSFVDSLFEEEVPTPTTQEEIATEPKIIQQIPMTQEEIVHESKFIQQTEVGRVLPFSPKSRDLYRHVFFHVVPSERYGWIL